MSQGTQKSKITFLFGAGASMDAEIPAVVQLAEQFRAEMKSRMDRDGADRKPRGDRDSQLLASHLERIDGAWQEHLLSIGKLDHEGKAPKPHFEQLYAILNHLLGLDTIPTLPLQLPNIFGPLHHHRRETELLGLELKKFVQKKVLYPKSLKYLEPLAAFYRRSYDLDFLSLNYDLCLERTLGHEGIPWTDGFDHAEQSEGVIAALPRFRRGTHRSPVRILKLHGSVSWYEVDPGRLRRRIAKSTWGLLSSFGEARTMTNEASMIYPTLHKALGRGPFPRMMSIAQQILADTRMLLVAGYRFGDPHILDLVVDALETNSELQVVLIDPEPESAFQKLAEHAPDHSSRIGIASELKGTDGRYVYGRLKKALANDWLLNQAERWLDGEPLPSPRQNISAAKRAGGRPWSVVLPAGPIRTFNYLSYSDNGVYYFVGKYGLKQKKIWRWAEGKNPEPVPGTDGFLSPRGLAWDLHSRSLLVVENRYRARMPFIGRFLNRAGYGRLWRVRQDSPSAFPITSLKIAATARLVIGAVVDKLRKRRLPLDEIARAAIPRWPSAILLDESGSTALLVEARRLSQIDLRTGRREKVLDIPLAFNVCGITRVSADEIFLVDGGVHPHGRGRVLHGNLATGEATVVYSAETGLGDVLYLPDRRTILVVAPLPWPSGEVLELDWSGGAAKVKTRWTGLDAPESLCVAPRPALALVGTHAGIIELNSL